MTETLPIDGRTVLTLASAATPIDGVERAFGSDAPFEEWNVLLVAYGDDHDRLRTAWCDRFGRMPAEFGSITIGNGTGTRPRTAPRPESRRDVTVAIPDPTNLAELGITIDLYLDEWARRPTLVCFHSIEDLMAHVGEGATFRFVRFLVGRLADAGAIGQFSLAPSALEESTLRRLETTFDVVREDDPGEPSLSPDAAFDVLGASHRRYVLHYLQRGVDPTTVEELADRVAGHDPAGSERIEASLRHTHLPKLEDAGLIARTGGRITARPAIASLAPYLDLVSERDFPG